MLACLFLSRKFELYMRAADLVAFEMMPVTRDKIRSVGARTLRLTAEGLLAAAGEACVERARACVDLRQGVSILTVPHQKAAGESGERYARLPKEIGVHSTVGKSALCR